MKLRYNNDIRFLKEGLYRRFTDATREDYEAFNNVRKKFYASWTPKQGYFGDCHYKVVVPALNKYEEKIRAPYEEYELLCLAVDSLNRKKINLNGFNKKPKKKILGLLQAEAKLIKKNKNDRVHSI